jgi:hypothetical protein
MYGPVALLLLVVVLYSVFWRVEADTLSARLDRANGGEIVPGVSFSFAQKSIGGFPFRLDVLLSGVNFNYRNGGADLAWRTDRLALHRLAYNPRQFIFEADGTQSLAWSARPDATPEKVSFTPETARASAILLDGRLVRFDMDFWRPRGQEQQPQLPELGFSADRAQLHALVRRNDTLDVVVQVDNALAGPAAMPALQTGFSLIDCRATLDHAAALVAVENGAQDVSGAFQQWRAQNGSINVTALTLNSPDAKETLRGMLGLDANDNLSGTLRGDRTGDRGATESIQLDFADGSVKLQSR